MFWVQPARVAEHQYKKELDKKSLLLGITLGKSTNFSILNSQ